MSDTAKLVLDGKEHDLDIVVGTQNERAIDIRKLRSETGYITLDSGFGNTGATTSGITYLDGENGILRYCGYPIEELAEKSTFVETAYLLIFGELPNSEQLSEFREQLTYHSMLHEGMRHFFDGFPQAAHPMGILSSMVCSLSSYYPDSLDLANQDTHLHITRLLSKIRTIAAYGYKHSIGQPMMYPRNELDYCANFLHMMFSVPAEPFEPNPVAVRALNMLLVLHADHEQNCSTSTVRLVGSSHANLYASISAGILALWGPLHGGANQAVIEMLEHICDPDTYNGDYKKFMNDIKDKKSGRRLMGFGHRVYKNYDPRAKILKKMADQVLDHFGVQDPLLDVGKRLEEIALADDYFVERKLYPNVDFYSGVVYKAMGIPTDMFTVMFALGRLPGWIAHWREMRNDPKSRIGRPRQVYTGATERHYVPIEERGK
ncbi:MAG: citrate synthase [Proteobacteria bacterium]|nr:citrate synthase [Pseudomonadota bacterium]